MENKIISLKNFEKICRTCLSEGELSPLFETCSNEDCLIEKIMSCTLIQIKENDGMPVNICTNCIQQINQAYTFAKKCESVDKILKKCIEESQKKISNLNKNNFMPENAINPEVDIKTEKVEELEIPVKNEIFVNEHNEINSIKIEGNTNDDDDFLFDNKSEINDDSLDSSVDDNDSKKYKNSVISNVLGKLNNLSQKKVKIKRKRRAFLKGPPYICLNCDITFESLQELKDHRATVKHTRLRSHVCHICNKKFTYWQLQSHMRTHTKEQPFLCSICGKGFSLVQNMRRHMMIHTGERPHQCSMCGKGFIQLTQLKDHIRVHTGEAPFECTTCGKAFKAKGLLRLHVFRRHEGGGGSTQKPKNGSGEEETIRKFECPTCHQFYKTKTILKQHILTHGEKRFLCSQCGKSFAAPGGLAAHLNVHTGNRPYSCQVCGKSFTQVGGLKTHQLIHTGEKKHICKLCNKAFTQPTHLKYHMRVHTGEKPYTCPFCNKTYKSNGTLTVHKRTHTGETPYVCADCGKGFYDSSSLKKHRKMHNESTI